MEHGERAVQKERDGDRGRERGWKERERVLIIDPYRPIMPIVTDA
jgi:hypothetical protein